MKFEVLPSFRERFCTDVKTREQATGRPALVQRTCYGRMTEVWNFKVGCEEKTTAKELATMYRGLLSSGREEVSDSFIDNTQTIMTRAISPHPDVQAEIESLENEHGRNAPLSEIGKMLVVAEQGKSSDSIRWCFLAIFDAFRRGDSNRPSLLHNFLNS